MFNQRIPGLLLPPNAFSPSSDTNLLSNAIPSGCLSSLGSQNKWGVVIFLMTRPELYSCKKLRLSVNDEPVQTFLFVRQDHFRDIIFHAQLSEEMKAGSYIVWLEKENVNLGTAFNAKVMK